MTCKDCVHYDVCLLGACINGVTGTCLNFKDKSRFIELPCKVGDTVYTRYDHLSHKQTNEMLECKVVFIGFGENDNYINIVDNYGHVHSMDFEIFDKTVFLNREETAKELRRSKR